MRTPEFRELVHEFRAKIEAHAEAKSEEYAAAEDRFADFRETAEAFGVPAELVLAIFLEKHLRAIRRYVREIVRTGEIPATVEPIEGRLGDAESYLDLFLGMVTERKRDESRTSTTRGDCTPAGQ